jgi:hypothetical protein
MTLRTVGLEVHDTGMREREREEEEGEREGEKGRERNKASNVRITQHCGVFVQQLLHWKSNKYYIF